ncbi:MAG: stage II sporulation protein M [Ruminiclostridium sp.]
MQTLMTEEEFLRQRNAVYEPDAKADESEKSDENREDSEAVPDRPVVIIGNENDKATKENPTACAIFISKKKNRYAAFILPITAVLGAVLGYILCETESGVISDASMHRFLSQRINGGFFGNAASSFIAAVLWCIIPFISGLCAVGQPVGVLIPIIKGIGIGAALAGLISSYGAGGIPAFAAFVLPSAVIGTLICCYQCRMSIGCSAKILSSIRGNGREAPDFYKLYLERFLVCCTGCFLLGIADAAMSCLLGGIFVI